MDNSAAVAAELVEGEVIQSDDLIRARNLHSCIVSDSEVIKVKIFDICVNLSIIRDDHLYTLLGYTNFKDYCSNALHYSLSTAKEYRVVGSFIRFIRSGDARDLDLNLDDLGVKKLYMIAKMQSGEFQRLRDSLDDPNDIYSLSTRDLRKKVNDLRAGVKAEAKQDPKITIDVPSAPDLDPVKGQWVSLCMQLRSLVNQMDSLFLQHSIELSESEVKHYLNRVSFAAVRDLKKFGGD